MEPLKVAELYGLLRLPPETPAGWNRLLDYTVEKCMDSGTIIDVSRPT